MRQYLECDVLIVGAGPAGSATAIHLSRAGLHVVLSEFQAFPRDKVCGDFVSPVALQQLELLGVKPKRSRGRGNTISKAAVYLDGQHLITNTLPRIPGLPLRARVIPREVLDESIVNAARGAGAQVLEQCRVTDFKVQARGVQAFVQCDGQAGRIRARVLIGADGSTSLIARLLRGNNVPSNDRIIAVRAYFKGFGGPPDRADLYFASETFPGYYWLFPASKTTANVGLGMILHTVPRDKQHLRDLLLQLIHKDAALRERLSGAEQLCNIAGWPLTTYNSALPIVGKRVCLVGDAAGLINPLNGEGIQYALLSAGWAADVIEECARRDDFSQKSLTSYARRIQKELQPDMAAARMIVDLIRNRSLNPVWLRGLNIITERARSDPEYAFMVGGVLAGLVPARAIFSLDIMQKTLQQAAFSLGRDVVRGFLRGPKHILTGQPFSPIGLLTTLRENHTASVDWGVAVATSALALIRPSRANSHAANPRKRAAVVAPRQRGREAIRKFGNR
jgi:geranylgeranyl reductase family protein